MIYVIKSQNFKVYDKIHIRLILSVNKMAALIGIIPLGWMARWKVSLIRSDWLLNDEYTPNEVNTQGRIRQMGKLF